MNNISLPVLKQLLVSHTFWVFTRTLFRLFISLYIWNLTNDLSQIAIFEIAFYISHTIFFWLFAPLAKKGYVRSIKNIGTLGMGLYLFLMFIVGDNVANHIIPVAVGYGIFNAMYWLSYHVLSFDLTHTKNRGNYAGLDRSLTTVANLLAPALGGFLISINAFGFGYGNIFLLGLAGIFACLLLGNIQTHVHTKNKFHLFETLKIVKKKTDLKLATVNYFFINFGQIGAIRKIIPIFLLTILASEFKVGSWISFFTFWSIITTLIIGKYFHYKYYKKLALFSGGLLSAATLSLIAWPGFVIYIIYGSIKEMLEPTITLVGRVYYQNLLHGLKDHITHRVEYLVIRETVNLTGRSLSFVPLLFITTFDSSGLYLLLVLMALSTFIAPLLLNRIKTDLTKL